MFSCCGVVRVYPEYISEYKPLIGLDLQIFSPFHGLPFALFVSAGAQTSSILWSLIYLVFLFVIYAFVSLPKSLPNHMSWSFCPMFSSKNAVSLAFTFLLSIHFELTFVNGERWGSSFILLHVDVQFFQHCLWKRLCFPPLNSLSTLVENHLTIHTKVCFWALCSVGLNVYPYVSITSFWLL